MTEQSAESVRTVWLHRLLGGCKNPDPNEWCNACFYRAWNSRHPDQARHGYDPRRKPMAAHSDGDADAR